MSRSPPARVWCCALAGALEDERAAVTRIESEFVADGHVAETAFSTSKNTSYELGGAHAASEVRPGSRTSLSPGSASKSPP